MARSMMDRYWRSMESVAKRDRKKGTRFGLSRSLAMSKAAILESMRLEGAAKPEIKAAAALMKHATYGEKIGSANLADLFNEAVTIHEQHGEQTLKNAAYAISKHAWELKRQAITRDVATHSVGNSIAHLGSVIGDGVRDFLNPELTKFIKGDIEHYKPSDEVKKRLFAFLDKRNKT